MHEFERATPIADGLRTAAGEAHTGARVRGRRRREAAGAVRCHSAQLRRPGTAQMRWRPPGQNVCVSADACTRPAAWPTSVLAVCSRQRTDSAAIFMQMSKTECDNELHQIRQVTSPAMPWFRIPRGLPSIALRWPADLYEHDSLRCPLVFVNVVVIAKRANNSI